MSIYGYLDSLPWILSFTPGNAFHRTQPSMNFPSMSPSCGTLFFTHSSSVCPFHVVQSFRNRFTWVLHAVTASLRCIHLLQDLQGSLYPSAWSCCSLPDLCTSRIVSLTYSHSTYQLPLHRVCFPFLNTLSQGCCCWHWWPWLWPAVGVGSVRHEGGFWQLLTKPPLYLLSPALPHYSIQVVKIRNIKCKSYKFVLFWKMGWNYWLTHLPKMILEFYCTCWLSNLDSRRELQIYWDWWKG